MKFNIPKSFELFGSDWKVKHDNKAMDDSNAFGDCSYSLKEIRLAETEGINKLSEDKKNQTFLHELTHAILLSMHEYEINKDEKFVNSFSELLYQFIKTAK